MRQLPLPLPFDPAMSADDFLVTSCNREAAAWIDKWPDWPALGLVITGLPGSGKTHILTLWQQKSGGTLLSEGDLLEKSSPALTAKTKALGIDNAHRLAGNSDAEEKLFHLFNHLKEIKGSLLLTMTRGVNQTGFLLPDLRSRLLTLPVAELLAPDDSLLEALIVKQFRDRQIAVEAGLVSYLARRIPRDAASVRDLIDRLDFAALAEGRKISTALARQLLEKDNDD